MKRKLPVIAVVAMLVLTAFASVPVAAEESVTVETESPTAIATSTATLQGNLTALEDADNATVWFEYWPAGDEANSSTTPTLTKTTTGGFSIEVTGLDSATQYVVVAHAETESGNVTEDGSEVTFTTEAEDALAVATSSATDVTDASATLNGELTELAGADNATVWFEYWQMGESANSSTTATQSLDGLGTFSAGVSGLANNTTYVFVAHAEAGNLSDSGEAAQFTTFDRAADLAVETLAASEVDKAAVTLNGQLTGMDGESETDVWFEYWVQGDAANATTSSAQTLTAPGSFSASISGLENATTYVYVAKAEANNTTVTGAEVTFTTTDATNDTANRTWDGEGPFGRWLTGILQNLVPADDQPLGQLVSDIVTANNPGSEQRSDDAQAGGNGQGPPDDKGKPDDAGPPEDKGKPDDAGPPDDKDQPEDAGPPDDKGKPADDTSSDGAEDDEDEDDEEEDDAGDDGQGEGNGQGNGK